MNKHFLNNDIKKSIELVNVYLTLKGPSGNVNILRGLDLSLNRGESVAIVGPSGSGKTSLLMVTSGVEKVTSGKVIIDGTDISSFNEDELAIFRRDNIGIVFQSFHLIPTMTALENVSVPLEFAKVKDPFQIAKSVLEDVGLSSRADHYPSQLSGGEQQRVALARSFAVQPKILLADEPTGNLDIENSNQIIDLLFALNKKNMSTLVLITHDLSLANHCDRVVVIEDGLIVSETKQDGYVENN
jgi:putative ABC transport system ATP-binding protein